MVGIYTKAKLILGSLEGRLYEEKKSKNPSSSSPEVQDSGRG
jgi:hypothetical protein